MRKGASWTEEAGLKHSEMRKQGRRWGQPEYGCPIRLCLASQCLAASGTTWHSQWESPQNQVRDLVDELEILEFEMTPNDEFLIVASDGVWEFLSNADVAKIAYPYYLKSQPEAAANAIVKEAYKKWKQVCCHHLI